MQLPIGATPEHFALALETYGACLVPQGDIPADLVNRFQDMLQEYYARQEEQKLRDSRPTCGYQVGYLSPGLEEPKCSWDEDCHAVIESLDPTQRPHAVTGKDPKARFHWRVANTSSKYTALQQPNVIPEDPPDDWQEVMDAKGRALVEVCHRLCEWLEEYYVPRGLPAGVLTQWCRTGPHLLAPTGMNLDGVPSGTVCAGFHYDIDLLTIHAKSRFPGLHIWTREGRRLAVRVPPGHLLVQAGKELEMLTGGTILAGYHEVVVDDDTVAAVEKARREGRSLVRVSSTVFYHAHPDLMLQAHIPGPATVTPMTAGEFLQKELQAIDLPVAKELQAH